MTCEYGLSRVWEKLSDYRELVTKELLKIANEADGDTDVKAEMEKMNKEVWAKYKKIHGIKDDDPKYK